MKSFLREMLSESVRVSLMRVVSLIVVFNVMLVWTIVCIYKREVVDMPWGVVSIVAVVVTGKAVQKFGENRYVDRVNS
uniref:Uncharacterized protein n=1 Tax=candidate division CPR3 bacterium TaxID=2268181 RepID=A0A7V3JAH1_UNCC3